MAQTAVEDQPTHQSVEEIIKTETTKVQIKLANATKECTETEEYTIISLPHTDFLEYPVGRRHSLFLYTW